MRLTRDGLIAAYHDYGTPFERWRVGAEFERHLLDGNGMPLPYFGEPGVEWLLHRVAEDGWEPYLEGDHPIALHRDGAAVTLEPGGQFELSGAPHDDVVGVDHELAAFNARVSEILEPTGYRQVALGYTPFATLDQIGWVPKGRYDVMRVHLAATGTMAHNMMKGTCATQASYDFGDEASCAEMIGLATRIGALTTGLFANSPLAAGEPTGFMSFRGHIWTHTDPARTGFPEAADAFTFERWVDYMLEVPMMFIRRGEKYVAAKGRTFADWIEDPVDPPTQDDWELHLTSVFPEVRVKRTIEVRGADCVDRPLAMAFTALFEGLFYDPKARREALEVAGRFTAQEETAQRFDVACREGLAGTIAGRRLADWAGDLYGLARAGLERQRPQDVPFLEPLVPLIEHAESPAVQVLRDWERDPTVAGVLARHPIDGR